jgi:hypothetical protein
VHPPFSFTRAAMLTTGHAEMPKLACGERFRNR